MIIAKTNSDPYQLSLTKKSTCSGDLAQSPIEFSNIAETPKRGQLDLHGNILGPCLPDFFSIPTFFH